MTKNKKRVLFVITDSGVGGSEKVILHLLKNLDRTLIDIVGIIVLKNEREMAQEWRNTSVPVDFLGMGYIPSFAVLIKLYRRIQKYKPDIVHAFLYHSTQLCRLIHFIDPEFQLISSPRVNYRILPLWALWLDRILKSQDSLMLAESSATQKYLSQNLSYANNKTHIVLNSVNTSEFDYREYHRAKWRKEWGITPEEVIIGAVGRLHPQKGFDVLINSLQGIAHVTLVVVGEGAEHSNLRALAEKKSVKVIFLGLCTKMSEIYSAFDIYVQSSRYEGMSNALLEAMSRGLPIVATNVDGTMDVAHDGENMLLVAPDQPTELSRLIKELIENKELRLKLSVSARKTAEKNSVQSMVKKFEEVYLKI